MNRPDQPDLRSGVERVLAEPAIAALDGGGAPVFVAAGDPARVVWANGAAQALFRAGNIEEITRRVFADPSGERLGQLAISLRPGAPARLERLRLAASRGLETLTFVCRRTDGPVPLFVAAAMGARPAANDPLRLATPIADYTPHVEAVAESLPAPDPVPAPEPGPRDAASVAAALAARFGDAAALRFLWKTDARNLVTDITGQLGDVTGSDTNALKGRDFLAVAAEAGVTPLASLASAFARRETWSGVELLWPVAGAAAAVPVTLGALPALDRERNFAGFHGFGVVHLQRVEARDIVPTETPVVETASEPHESAAAPDIAPVEDVVAVLPEPVAPAPPSAPVAVVAPPPLPPVNEEDDPLDHEPAPRPEAPWAVGANVVPLRPEWRVGPPAAAHVPDPPKDTGLKPTPDRDAREAETDDAGLELSAEERTNFREIAQILRAQAEAQAAARAKAEESAKPAPPAEPEAPPVIATETRGLRIRDLIDDEKPVAEAPAAAPALPVAPRGADAMALLDRVPAGVLVSRMEIPVYLNRTLLDLLGFVDADAFHAAGGLERMFRGRQPGALTEAAGGGAIPVVTRVGEVVSAVVKVQAIDWEGEPASLLTFQPTREADLAPRVRSLEAEARQRDAELRELHAILDTATDGVVVLDPDGKILGCNRSAEALFGYEQNEIAGENFTILLAKESQGAAADYLAGLKANGVATVMNDGRDVIGRARQGGTMPMFMTLGRVSQAGAHKFCAVLRDMTQWKKAERELGDARREAERASALKSDFLARVSHEIRTPLNAIIGFAEVIMEERFGPVGTERYKDYLKDIHASGAHVMSLVNDLLDLSKIESGKMELNFVSLDANRVVAECVSLIQAQAMQERVVIRQSLAQRLPNIEADERSLRQIVLNLLSNAVKFNEPGGQVIVSTALTDAGHAVIRVKDTGIGMTEAEVLIALEPFRQLQTSRSHGGTGLGLPLTKSLVEANHASFTIKSRKKEGTLVEVAFPPTRVLTG